MFINIRIICFHLTHYFQFMTKSTYSYTLINLLFIHNITNKVQHFYITMFDNQLVIHYNISKYLLDFKQGGIFDILMRNMDSYPFLLCVLLKISFKNNCHILTVLICCITFLLYNYDFEVFRLLNM
jgi:hypothetical protein